MVGINSRIISELEQTTGFCIEQQLLKEILIKDFDANLIDKVFADLMHDGIIETKGEYICLSDDHEEKSTEELKSITETLVQKFGPASTL